MKKVSVVSTDSDFEHVINNTDMTTISTNNNDAGCGRHCSGLLFLFHENYQCIADEKEVERRDSFATKVLSDIRT